MGETGITAVEVQDWKGEKEEERVQEMVTLKKIGEPNAGGKITRRPYPGGIQSV